MDTAGRLRSAEVMFAAGGPRDVHDAIADLQLLVRETLNCGSPAAADSAHRMLQQQRAAEAQAVLDALSRLEVTDSKAECQRVLECVETFVTRWNRGLGRR